jgi:hypothetical protein
MWKGKNMNLTKLNIGSIFSFVVMILLTVFGVFDWKILLFFILLKFEFTFYFKK